MIIIILIISVLSIFSITLSYFLFRALRRLFEFDDLFELLVHDIEVNNAYFDKLVNTPLLANSPEILDAQRSMRIMRDRFEEYISNMEELSRKKLRSKEKKIANPPVVR